MKKEYIKPTSHFIEIRMEERLAECSWVGTYGAEDPGCEGGIMGPGFS